MIGHLRTWTVRAEHYGADGSVIHRFVRGPWLTEEERDTWLARINATPEGIEPWHSVVAIPCCERDGQ